MSPKRQAEILRAVRQSGSGSVSALAEQLGVSTETIRRDIKALLASGAVLRFHGGIMDPAQLAEPPFARRMQAHKEAKRKIAALVLDMVRDGDSLILDNGTTSAYVAEALAARARLVVVTNSAEIACRLAGRNNHRIFMAGGELADDAAATFGAGALAFIRQFQVRYNLVSLGGINAQGELADFHLGEAEFARAAMAQAEESWVIADASKFGRPAPVKICALADVQKIVTDAPPPASFAESCLVAGVAILAG